MATEFAGDGCIWAKGEMDAAAVGDPPLPEIEATEAEPGAVRSEAPEFEDPTNKLEEIAKTDQDVKNKTSQEVNQTPSEPQEQETHLVAEQAPKVTDESPAVVEDTSPTPPPSCSDPPSPAEGGAVIETENQAAPEAENRDRVGNVEVISDRAEDATPSDSRDGPERPPTPRLDDPAVEGEVPPVEVKKGGVENGEMTGEVAATGESTPERQDATKPAEELPEGVETGATGTQQSLSRDSSDDTLSVESLEPTAASEGEAERQNMDRKLLDSTPAGVQDDTGDKPPRPDSSTTPAGSQTTDAASQPSVPSEEQQGEQLPQGLPAPGREDQEAQQQQVFDQGTPPPGTVAMEPANRGEAGSPGSGCAVTGEREKEEEEEGKREGAGGEDGRNDTTGEAEEKKRTEQTVGDSERVEIEGEREEKPNPGSSAHDDRGSGMETEAYDDSQSDSGVSADFSPGGTAELPAVPPAAPAASPPANETPIEREIRRAVQREQSLRRSRGLREPAALEYVDIPLRRAILTRPLPSKFEKDHGKDKQFAGKKMQKEIRLETQREQVLVQLGKVPGFYDKGSVRQLKERKKLFEAFQEPKDSSSTVSPRSKASSWASAGDFSAPEVSGDESSYASTTRGSFPETGEGPEEAVVPPLGPGLSEGTVSPMIILEDGLELQAAAPRPAGTPGHSSSAGSLAVVDSASLRASSPALSGEEDWGSRSDGEGRNEEEEEEEKEVVPRENPFFKLRPSMALDKVGQDIQEARERERELRRQRSSLYGGAGAGAAGARGGRRGGRGRLESLEAKSHGSPLLSANGVAAPDRPVTLLKTGSGTPTVRQSLGKLGMWPPVQTNEEEQISQPESPRTPRQKTPLLQRWENGLVNGREEEEEEEQEQH